MSKKMNASRRAFLRTAGLMSVAATAAPPFALNLMTMGAAAAQTVSDYKAIVCLFMAGGNDHANTVLATDPGSWASYQAVRATGGADSIDLPGVGATGGVLPITPKTTQAGREFALNPNLGPLKSLFDAGRVAIVANVGPLVAPTTLAQYKAKSVPLPPKLFSHNDQQSLWQSFSPEGSNFGWGGRAADLLASMNVDPTFMSISVSGNSIFTAGRTITQYQVSPSGAVPTAGLFGNLSGVPAASNPMKSIITNARSNNVFERDLAALVKRSLDTQDVLAGGILPSGAGGVAPPPQYVNPSGVASTNPLANQLQTVARIIGGRNKFGIRRQVFFVSMGGFDTHNSEKVNHADLMAKLAHAFSYFDTTMATLGGVDMRSQVTLFTASDFGRTFASNGDGTDHGWGSHHFVLGGAVKGKDIYGTFPVTGLNHAQDVGSGVLLPAISVDQYAGTLARWFGLTDSQILDVFPNMVNFSNRNLGFMG